MAKSQILIITDTDKKYLESVLRLRTAQAQMVNRARILLLKSEGQTIDSIADKLGIDRKSIMLCLKKYNEGGVEHALSDAPGRGRNPEITDEEKAWIIDIACRKPSESGYADESWTYAKLTRHINSSAEAAGYTRLSTLTKTSIKNILDIADIKPFKIKYYYEKCNPDVGQKMHDVLIVYKQVELQYDENGNIQPFDGQAIHNLSYDEKFRIQAIPITSLDKLTTIKAGTIMKDYEYKRVEMLFLLVGIDLHNGEAIPLVSDTHKSPDFIEFLKILDKKYPREDKIRAILDNYSAHTSKETRAFLATVPGRFEFVFTPKHGVWLNMIEGFFSKMICQMLHGIRAQSKEELTKRIYNYIDDVNEVPVTYHWKYKLDEVIL